MRARSADARALRDLLAAQGATAEQANLEEVFLQLTAPQGGTS